MSNMNDKKCPNFDDLLENRKLRHDLERERQRREDAEKHSRVLTTISFVVIALIAGLVMLLITYSGMSAEVIHAYRLFGSFAFLLFGFGFALASVNWFLGAIKRHNQRKSQDEKREDHDNV